MNVVCAPAPWRRIRLPGWVRPLPWRPKCLKKKLLKYSGSIVFSVSDWPIFRVCINGSPTQRIAHTLSFTFTHNDLDVAALGDKLAFSSTSACNSEKNLPSHVLLALGLSPQAAGQTIRLSLGRFTRDQDIERAAESIHACLIQPAFWAVAQSR
ncbi:Cysteine desulfurase [Pseudomonas savastanoi]|uniref:Cysteine desulfurase n=1 Tax=Pseudomonas savastanoi TaxID=29438 RepID=A0A3M6A351_PSESS|nr:Cysteine desulfurase [Pseudomonas savastanoi]